MSLSVMLSTAVDLIKAHKYKVGSSLAAAALASLIYEKYYKVLMAALFL